MKESFAGTPEPPYYAVIFSSLRGEGGEGYADMARRMLELAQRQEGYLGAESARVELGITVSYWKDRESIRRWKEQAEHREAQRLGKERWYTAFRIRIARVEEERIFEREVGDGN
ncbi:antibiotic biosynthesis monooxygenase family protein [Nitratifractor sp.]